MLQFQPLVTPSCQKKKCFKIFMSFFFLFARFFSFFREPKKLVRFKIVKKNQGKNRNWIIPIKWFLWLEIIRNVLHFAHEIVIKLTKRKRKKRKNFVVINRKPVAALNISYQMEREEFGNKNRLPLLRIQWKSCWVTHIHNQSTNNNT